jgi:hypothetical protein
MGAEMRIALAAIAAGIAVLTAGAGRLDATAGTDECSSLSTVSMYALAWPEIRGTTNRGQLWVTGGLGPSAMPGPAVLDGLVSQPLPLKWIWRMTGTGPFRIVAIAPRGMRVNPVWGPDRHGGSNWTHPGAEWGTGWFFWEQGCWRIHATRGKTHGDVFVQLR